MFVCLGERERHRVRKTQTHTHTHPASVYIPLFDLGIHWRQNKNHTPAASRQSEIYLHSLLSPGRWMGPIWSPLQDPLWEWRRRRDATQTCTNLKTERFGRCYLWNPGGTPEGWARERAAQALCRVRRAWGFWKRASRDSWLLTLSALLRILQGVLLAPGAEPGKGTGNKRERQKIKSYNGNINCLSCGFYKTHKMFSFCLVFFSFLWIGALPFCMENTSMGFTAQLQGLGLTALASFGHIFSFNEWAFAVNEE